MSNLNRLAILIAAGLLASCASMQEGGPKASASLQPTKGNTVAGVVNFVQMGDKVQVVAEISGLTPGLHGFHVHEKGDCSAPDGTSAGGHFNPGGKSHGHPDAAEHHAGDLPQLTADASGVAKFSAFSTTLSVGGGDGNVLGRAMVVHAGVDDFKTQPAGNSGPRVACGVIVAQ